MKFVFEHYYIQVYRKNREVGLYHNQELSRKDLVCPRTHTYAPLCVHQLSFLLKSWKILGNLELFSVYYLTLNVIVVCEFGFIATSEANRPIDGTRLVCR